MSPEETTSQVRLFKQGTQETCCPQGKVFQGLYSLIPLSWKNGSWLAGFRNAFKATFLLSMCKRPGFLLLFCDDAIRNYVFFRSYFTPEFLMKHQGFQAFLLWFVLLILILKLDRSNYTHATAWMLGFLKISSIGESSDSALLLAPIPFFLWDRVSLCRPGGSGVYYVN